MLRRSFERWSRAEFQCGIPEVTSFVVMDAKSCVKIVNIPENHEIAAGNAICR